jgi:hypothetical protein
MLRICARHQLGGGAAPPSRSVVAIMSLKRGRTSHEWRPRAVVDYTKWDQHLCAWLYVDVGACLRSWSIFTRSLAFLQFFEKTDNHDKQSLSLSCLPATSVVLFRN